MILTVTLNPCVDTTIFVRDHRHGRIHRSERVTRIAGGKGINASRVIHELGETTVALVVVAGHTGRLIRDLIGSDSIPSVPVWVEGESRQVVTILETDSADYAQTAYVEPGASIPAEARVALFQRFAKLLDRARVVLLTGPAPDPMSTDIYAEMVMMARSRGLPVFLDSRGGALREAVRRVPTLVKPNEAEAAEWRGAQSLSPGEREKVVDEFASLGSPWVLLTLGEEGALVLCEGRRYRATPPPVKTVNPIGSGDVLVGAMAVGWARSQAPEDIIRLGIAAGAANAGVWAAGSCTRAQIEALIDRVELHPM